MRTGKWVGVGLVLAGALVLQMATSARAEIGSDRAAAIVIYPKIVVNGTDGTDTVVQIGNTSSNPVSLHCFYIDASSHCSISRNYCDPNNANPCPTNTSDLCLPGWVETDFRVILTAQQPVAWIASRGLTNSDIPLDGTFNSNQGQSNVGTRVPPVSENPFVGELKCIVVDEQQGDLAVPRNVIKGEATIVSTATGVDVEKYNAVGLPAIDGDSNGDNILELGGSSNEYDGCSNVLIVDHFFDFASNPVNGASITSDLTLVPCNEDLLNQIPGTGVAQYLVFNEFEQRFSTSTPVQCFFERPMSLIDTRNPVRSIFSVYVAGTLTGQTRIRGVATGFIGLLREKSGNRSAAINVHLQGERDTPDRIVLP